MSENTSSPSTENKTQKQNLFFKFVIIAGLAAFAYIFFTLTRNEQLLNQLAGVKQLFSPTQLSETVSRLGVPDEASELAEDGSATTTNGVVTAYVLTAKEDGATAFDLLRSNHQVEFDQYDFGVFVTAINGQQANQDYYWAVYVNGEYAQVASDQLELQAGDQVEWRWEEMQGAFD